MIIKLNKSQCILMVQAIRMIKLSFSNSKLKNSKDIKSMRRRINKIEDKLSKVIPADYYKEEMLKLQLLIAMNFKKWYILITDLIAKTKQ